MEKNIRYRKGFIRESFQPSCLNILRLHTINNPIRGKGVYLRLIKRRWRHKKTGAIIKRDYSFMAEDSKFTVELSDFLKDASGYKARYHKQYSELLLREEQNSSKTLY